MLNSRLKSLLVRLGLGAAAAVVASAASAAPIPSWDYIVSSQFVNPTTTFTAGGGCQSFSATSITWGGCPNGPAGTNRSGIGISNTPQAGVLPTNGAAQPANTYTHNNNVVSADLATLRQATIQAQLQLRPTGSGLPYEVFSATYTILFAETPNQAPCAVATSPTPCNDIWVLSGSLNNSFTVGGDQYFFSFFASPALASLPNNVCTAAGAAPGCIGFTTVEGQPNAVNFLMAITSEPITVPEPSSLALLGLGLLGFVALRRRTAR